jgi:CxxC motif-containing protein (DUF1111 family)
VSNEAFSNERSAVAGCVFNGSPEDATKLDANGEAAEVSSDLVTFAGFMRFLAPPTPAPTTNSTQNGALLFVRVGCALCHSPSLTTGMSRFTGMSNFTYHPYSDFALHHMGEGLADGINQGAAGPDQFRTAPLWGVGQRLFFLHDGRTSDLLKAIEAHADCGGDSRPHGQDDHRRHDHCDSEANGVIRNFNMLSVSEAQDILNFLRSL